MGHLKRCSQKQPIITKLIKLMDLPGCVRSNLQLAAPACCNNWTEAIVDIDIPPITVFLINAVSMANTQTWFSTTTLLSHFSCRYVFHGKKDIFLNLLSSSVWSESHACLNRQRKAICFFQEKNHWARGAKINIKNPSIYKHKKPACIFLGLQEINVSLYVL